MSTASLFNLAGPDLIIILLIVLLLFGAKKLPGLSKAMGQAIREFSKAKDEFEREATRSPESITPLMNVALPSTVGPAFSPLNP